MKVKCWKIHILTLILSIAVSHGCTRNHSGRNRSKTDESTQWTKTGDRKLFIISAEEKKDETQNRGNGANKDKRTETKNEKREEIVKRRLGKNLQPNLQLATRIIPFETFPKVFPGLDDPHTYTDFILAIGKFPVCTQSPSTCHQELASMAAFADKARCAGKIVTFLFNSKN